MLRLLLLTLILWQGTAQTSSNDEPEGPYFVSRSKSVRNNDINCNKLDAQGKTASYCYQCGGIAAVASACSNNERCRGFDMQDFSCGYLKTRADPAVLQDQPGFASFCRAPPTPDAPGYPHVCRGEWLVFAGYDAATGTDYNCNYKEEGVIKSFCKRDGEVVALMDECDRNPGGRCDGFVVSIENNGNFGVLKRMPSGRDNIVKSLRRRPGYMYFVKTGLNPK